MIKKHYKKEEGYWWNAEWYEPKYSRYVSDFWFRERVRTHNERKQNSYAIDDGYYVRGKRRPTMIPTKWDDISCSRWGGKSWKDYTKARKQYMKNTN